MSKQSEQGFNAASRARKREARPITIGEEGEGERKFFPRRRTAPVMKHFRELLRQDVKLAGEQGQLETGDVAGLERIEEAREELLYELLAALIYPEGEKDGEVDTGFLAAELDIDDAREMLRWLMPKREVDDEDPQVETASLS